MRSTHTMQALGQHDLSASGADDSSSRHQKMLQQRQLALKRQRDLAKSSCGQGVTAQLNTPLDTSAAQNMQNKALGWGKMLQAGIDGSACSSNMMRIIVPADEEELLSSPRQQSPGKRRSPLQASVQDTGLMSKASEAPPGSDSEHLMYKIRPHVQRSDSEHQKMPALLQGQRSFQESAVDNCWSPQSETKAQDETPRRKLFRMLEPTLDNYWDSQIEAQTNGKSLSRKLWRPWGSSKRTNSATETVVEKRVVVLPAAEEDTQEKLSAISIDRAGTPWEPPCDSSALEGSIWYDVSSLPGFSDLVDGQIQDHNPDVVKTSPENIFMAKDGEPIQRNYDNDADDGESIDSGIEQSLSEWKSQENQSPNQKKSRFNRFISTVQVWRAAKGDVNAVTRIEVNPAINPDPVIDLD